MPLWSTIPGTRIPAPKQRPEQKAALHQYRAVVQGKAVPTTLGRKYRRSTLDHPWGGSDNWSVADASLDAINGNPCRAWWEAVQRSYETRGHHHAEWCSINYSDRTFLSLAITVAYLQDPNHPAAEILRRDLLLFAILARPIVARDGKGRVVYEGYGWRRAGLRSTANHWPSWLDSYLCASILGLPATVTARGKRQEREFVAMVESVARLAWRVLALADDGFDWVPDFADVVRRFLNPAEGVPAIAFSALRETAAPLRTPPGMSAILARDVQSGDTFSCLLGTRVGNNTAATWAAHAKGPELRDVAWCYPWRDAKGAPIKRVRTGKLKRAGRRTGWLMRGAARSFVVADEKGYAADGVNYPSWLYDDTRAIRLEVFHNKPAVLSLPS